VLLEPLGLALGVTVGPGVLLGASTRRCAGSSTGAGLRRSFIAGETLRHSDSGTTTWTELGDPLGPVLGGATGAGWADGGTGSATRASPLGDALGVARANSEESSFIAGETWERHSSLHGTCLVRNWSPLGPVLGDRGWR
jgi:hypothetical protein